LSQDPIGFDGGLNLFTYVGNNPITFADPEGLIQRRANGQLRMDVDRSREGGFMDMNGTKVKVMPVILYANDNTPIEAYISLDASKKPKKTNCFGKIFADGRYVITESAQVDRLLKGDGYKRTNNPVPGDIVLYKEGTEWVHGLRVTGGQGKTATASGTAGGWSQDPVKDVPINKGWLTPPNSFHTKQRDRIYNP